MTTTDPAVAFLRAFYNDPDGVGPHYSAAHVSAVRKGLDAALGSFTGAAAEKAERDAQDHAQWLATIKAQQAAAEFAGELAAQQGDLLDKITATLDRLAEGPRPTDYEVWRDALTIAAAIDARGGYENVGELAQKVRLSLMANVADPDYAETDGTG